MFMAKDFQPFQLRSLWNSPCSNNTTAFLQPSPSGVRNLSLKTSQLDGVQRDVHYLPPRLESLTPSVAPFSNESQCPLSHGHGVQAPPSDVSSSTRKRFLIFDQSGNQIRLFSSSFHLPFQNQIIVPEMPVSCSNLLDIKCKAGQTFLANKIARSKADENYSGCEGGERHEDTEEINALLYSGGFSEDDDDVGSENDELTSTGHSPLATTGWCEKHEKICQPCEEVADIDGSNKRRKLLDGGYKKSSLVHNASSLKLARSSSYDDDDDDDAQSGCAKGRDPGEDMDSILSTEQSRAKVRGILRTLGSILPGKKGKDPILIIDEAINYLKSLRQKAKALRVNHPEVQSPLLQ